MRFYKPRLFNLTSPISASLQVRQRVLYQTTSADREPGPDLIAEDQSCWVGVCAHIDELDDDHEDEDES